MFLLFLLFYYYYLIYTYYYYYYYYIFFNIYILNWLFSNESFSIYLPKCFRNQIKNQLIAGPTTVNLYHECPYFYQFGYLYSKT